MRPRLCLALACLALAALVPTGAGGAAGGPTVVPSKVERVVVYSQQARVFRSATVTLAGEATFGVADLPSALVEGSLRVESKTAEVVRVEVTRTREHLPRQAKAKELADKIEAVLERLRALRDERQVLQSELELVGGLRLTTLPVPRDGKPAAGEGLFSDAWRRILAWVEARSGKDRTRLLALAADERKEQRTLYTLQVEAKGLDLYSASEAVPRVLATLRGKPGKHQVTVSYLVSQVRWRPTYDLGYDHRSRSVEAAYYALVEQRTGEDWVSAQLLFSTTQPVSLVAIPELPTWTLGRQRDFTPTPRPRLEPAARVWTPPPPIVARDAAIERLRAALAEASPSAPMGRDEERRLEERPVVPKPEPKPRAEEGERVYDRRAPMKKPAPMAESVAPAPVQPSPSVNLPGAPPPPSPPARAIARASGGMAAPQKPAEELPWTEQGYRPPPVDPDSPSAGAEGYRFTLYAPGRHTVAGAGAQQRVPLLRQRFAVSPTYRILPGLSPSAYLIASVTNGTGKPILRGPANVFSGAMFTGQTWINTALPGRKIVLPLGVDDAIKVVRHLTQKTASQGVVFKDDVTVYTVQLEVANHRRHAVQVEVEDQVPVKDGDKVQVKAFSSDSFGKPDERGKVLWKGSVGASSVKKLSFSFQLVRPKDWDLVQHDS